MGREHEIYRQVGVFSLIGMSLCGLAFFAPDAGSDHHGLFFNAARQTSWREPLDFAAAWCSLKIILCSAGLFLLIESVGTVLSVWKYKSLALAVYFLQAVPCLGALFGGFYLIKALL